MARLRAPTGTSGATAAAGPPATDGGPVRVTVPEWQLSENTAIRTPAANAP
jgi:hypothetical protein